MDLQTYLSNAVSMARKARMAQSDQLTLGRLIEILEPIAAKQKDREDKATVRYDFDYLFPTTLYSWRGAYEELALNFTSEGEEMKVTAFLQMLKDAVGKSFYGYKGGDFTMDEDTPLWVAEGNHSGNTAIVDVLDNEYVIILITGYREY